MRASNTEPIIRIMGENENPAVNALLVSALKHGRGSWVMNPEQKYQDIILVDDDPVFKTSGTDFTFGSLKTPLFFIQPASL